MIIQSAPLIIQTAPPASPRVVAPPGAAMCNRHASVMVERSQRDGKPLPRRSASPREGFVIATRRWRLRDRGAAASRFHGVPPRPLARLVPSLLLGLSLNLAIGAVQADYPLTILELQHRLPEDLIPVLAPLAGADGVVTGANDSLFVRASPDRLADIRAALARLDSPARNLLVEVRRGSSMERARASIAVTIDEPLGDHGRIRVGPDRQTGLRAGAGRQSDSGDLLQQVRVLDGGQAFIRVGTEWPLGYREVYTGPYGTRVQSGIEAVSADTGFYVRPRANGDRVVVDISSRAAEFGRRGTIDSSAVDTQISGRLGEWLPFGGSQESAEGRSNALTGRGRVADSERHDLEVRVRALD